MQFLRLIRPINLLIIVLTMFGTVFYLERIALFRQYDYDILNFWLLVFSTVLIAAAGNIINDYFDVRADRINKPDKLIITKYIKRRWAIVSHWLFNGVAFCIGIYLSIFYDTLVFVFIQLISINALWFYSMYFKRKVLVGNLIVAFLTSLIPILSLTFMYYSPGQHNQWPDPSAMNGILDADFTIVHVVAFFAFIQNFAREIVKDVQDIEGDKLIHAKSLPMVLGISRTMLIVIILLLIIPFYLMIGFFSESELTVYAEYSLRPSVKEQWFFILAGITNMVAIVYILLGKKNYKLIDRIIKISMLLGIIAFFQLALL